MAQVKGTGERQSADYLDDIARFKQERKPQSRTIDEFKAILSKGSGMARAAKYEVVLYPPDSLSKHIGIDLAPYSREISLLCDTIAMPGHDLQTHPAKYGTGLATEMANGHGYEGTIEATFYLDTNFETQSYFTLWQDAAIDKATNKVRYYKDYAGSMEIYQLSSDYSANQTMNSPFDGLNYTGKWEGPANRHRNTRQVNQMVTKRTYGMLVEEVYPETIGSIEYAYATVDTVALLPVEFQYRKWTPLDPTTLDEVGRMFTRG